MGRLLLFSALELCRLIGDRGAPDVLAGALRLGEILEKSGYERLWFAEHHTPGVAHASPEVVVAAVAGRTSSIAVGAGGLLLRHHEAARAARAWLALEGLFPGRVDLGLARAGSVGRDAGDTGAPEIAYRERVEEILRCLKGECAATITPANVPPPRVWLLGSGQESAGLAARFGLRYCHAAFLPSSTWKSAALAYRREFVPSVWLAQPYVAIAAAGACASSEARAIEQVALHGPGLQARIVGSPDICRAQAEALCKDVDADELIFVDMSTEHETKRESYQLLASEMISIQVRDGPLHA